MCGEVEGISLKSDINGVGLVCLHLGSIGEAVILEEFRVQPSILILDRRGFEPSKGLPQGWVTLRMCCVHVL